MQKMPIIDNQWLTRTLVQMWSRKSQRIVVQKQSKKNDEKTAFFVFFGVCLKLWALAGDLDAAPKWGRVPRLVPMSSRRSGETIRCNRWNEPECLQVELFAKTFYLCRSLFDVYRCPEARLTMKEFGVRIYLVRYTYKSISLNRCCRSLILSIKASKAIASP